MHGSDLSEQAYIEKKETIDTSWSYKDAFENVCTQDSTPKSCSGTLGQVKFMKNLARQEQLPRNGCFKG